MKSVQQTHIKMTKFEILEKLKQSISNLIFHTGLDPFASGSQRILRWFVPVYCLIYWSSACLTMYESVSEKNIASISTGGSTIGFGLQAAATLMTFYVNLDSFQYQFADLVQFYNELSNYECRFVQTKLELMWTFCQFYKYACFCTIGFVIVAPAIPGNNQPLPLVLTIPLLDDSQSPDYQLTYFVQTVILIYSVRFFCALHQFCIILIFHFGVLVDLMTLRMESNATTVRNLITHHKRLLSLHEAIEDIFGLFFTTQIIGSVFQISLGIYICMSHKLFQNYVLTVLSFFQLFVTCTYGYYFQRKCDSLIVTTFNFYRWNELDLGDQKAIRLMLMMAQQKCQLRIGPSGYFEICYELYLKVNKELQRANDLFKTDIEFLYFRFSMGPMASV